MTTRDRRRLVGQAVWYFLRQDYPSRELVIVDDGEDRIADLLPGDPRIRYVRPSGPLSPGDRLNLACEHAMGELIAAWDDGAWYGPDRLSAQVRSFEDPGIDVAALDGLEHYHPLSGRVWRHESESGSRATLNAGSLVFRKAYWAEHRFPPRGGAIAAFLESVHPGRLRVGDVGSRVVVVLHGRSLFPVNPADPRWRERPFAEVGRLLDLDLRFYARRHGDGAAEMARIRPAPVTLAATFMVYDGYGSMAEYLALGMARAGADIHVAPFRIDPAGLSAEFQDLWGRSKPDPDGIVLCHAWWGENLARYGSARDLFIKTVWETSRLPADWPARLDRASAVIVPSRFAAGVFRASGVRSPIEVVHEGVDPAVYSYQERPERAGPTTLIVGVLAPRKNYRHAVAAWQLAFADDPEARLILKARFQVESYRPEDPRIRVVDTNEPTRGIMDWYRQADVLLALGNEGFGLPLIEGMATGLPVVALNSEAQADVCEEASGLVLPVRPESWVPATAGTFGACGVRALPDVEDAARQLRWIAEHRQEAQEMGRRASDWAHARRNVWDMGPAALAVIERHARTPRPLRRSHAIWAPAAAGSSPYEWYCDDLVRSLDRVIRYREPPSSWRSTTLHVQHAPGLFDEQVLTRQIQAARQRGLAVLVTLHHVREHAEAWEPLADVLVVLDPAAESRLRARWPRGRIERIPPGCPPWRPSSRDGMGRRVASIGASGLEYASRIVATALPDARLIADISASPAVLLKEPGGDAPPPSGEALAGWLNEHVDAIILGHPHTSMPSPTVAILARIALASGAPVLIAPGCSYADMADVTRSPQDLAEGLRSLLTDRAGRANLAAATQAFCEENRWTRVAALHQALWSSLAP